MIDADRESALKAVDNVFETYTGESAVPALVDLILRREREAKIEALQWVCHWIAKDWELTVKRLKAEIARLEAERPACSEIAPCRFCGRSHDPITCPNNRDLVKAKEKS